MMKVDHKMHGCSHGHGALFFMIVGMTLVAPLNVWGQEVFPARSRVFDIEYTVNENALPLDSVQLWYTLDRGKTWHQYGMDEDRQSPMIFQAPQEGLYGFYLILTNKAGASSAAPSPTTVPHQWAFVDYTKPVVQLHQVRQTTSLGVRVLQIRWTAIDANFSARPISISYQRIGQPTWFPVTVDPLGNTGKYDWRVPDQLSGSMTLRVSAVDKGGHHVESDPQYVDILPEAATLPQAATVSADRSIASSISASPSMTALSGSKRASERAQQLFKEAIALRDENEFRMGISRLREAIKLDPQRTEAFVEMAGMLYRIGNSERSLNAYDIALRQNPGLRSALQGSAMVFIQKRDYSSAAKQLRTFLRYNPNDAEIWMNLGDVAIYQGDEVMARECYLRATQIDSNAIQVIKEAQKRLDLMMNVSRNREP